MSTFTQILYQLVFSTYKKHNTLIESGQERLYKYISGIIKKKNCHMYCINGVENNIHIITHIHPVVAPAMLVKDIKLAGSAFIKEEKLFPAFNGWQDGYGAFTYSIPAKDKLVEYVKNQKLHHQKVSFEDEYIELLKEHEIDIDERFFL